MLSAIVHIKAVCIWRWPTPPWREHHASATRCPGGQTCGLWYVHHLVFCVRTLFREQIKGSKDYIRQLFVDNSYCFLVQLYHTSKQGGIWDFSTFRWIPLICEMLQFIVCYKRWSLYKFVLEILLFFRLYFFFWPFCCLFFFDIRFLIAPLLSSKSSFEV